MYTRYLALPIALLAASVAAQTSTDCSPLNSTSCPTDPALGTTFSETYNSSSTAFDSKLWDVLAGDDLISFNNNGANLAIAQKGDSVTLKSSFYIFWGSVEIMMQAAAGTGIISTVVLLSDDLDEIDLEIMGGNTSFVESNWYGHGNQSQFNALYHPVDGPQAKLHNYTVVWNQQSIEWIIDGTVARTVPYAPSGQYPQTPSFIRFGIWAAGDSDQEGTITWAGGKTDWSQGPFTMTVQSIKITDGSTNTTEYAYGDQTGSFSSITSTPGVSVAAKELAKGSTLANAQQQWTGLSTGAKIGIAAGVGGGFVLLMSAWCAFCCVQRKKGRVERQLEDQRWNEQTAELLTYRQQMAKGAFAVQHMGHGEKY